MPSPSPRVEPGFVPIEIIVVGCGFSGLACAIEAKRRGHIVTLFEKHPSVETLGDVISFAPNTGRLFEKWGLGDQLMSICTQHPVMYMHNFDGELLAEQPLPQKLCGSNSYNGRRGEIHGVLLQYAKRLGVDLRFGQVIKSYWEDTESGRAGVVVADERIGADIVIGADGVRSRARELVLGHKDKPEPSGYAIYRAWFNSREQGLDTDPLTDFFCKPGGDFHAWMGKDVHMLAMSFHDGEEMCWVLTHKDECDITEAWSYPGKITDVLKYVEGWDPRCAAIIRKAPSCVDWKLVQRPPLPTWVSDSGRTAVIGDAAHPFLPTSIQGASQGVEDGVTLATVLDLAGKKKVPLAARTFEYLRYDRVRRAQEQGESTRDRMHADPDARGDADEDVQLPFPEWLLNHDAAQYAMDHFREVSQRIIKEGYVRPGDWHTNNSESTR